MMLLRNIIKKLGGVVAGLRPAPKNLKFLALHPIKKLSELQERRSSQRINIKAEINDGGDL